MPAFTVTARGEKEVRVDAINWIVALGMVMDELGRTKEITRLAAEVLPNQSVIARDISGGRSFIIEHAHKKADVALTDPLPSIDEALAMESEEEEDSYFEPVTEEIEELPLEAIAQLTPTEYQLASIDQADTLLMACRKALAVARERVPAESGAVILEEQGHLRFLAVDGPHARKLMGVRLPKGTGVAGFAMRKRRSIVLAQAHEDPRHCGEVDALTGYQTREIAVIPLTHHDQVLGVIELMNLPNNRRFQQEDVEQIQQVARALTARIVA